MSDFKEDTLKSSHLVRPCSYDQVRIRRVTLGGDIPGLQAEADFLKHKRKTENDQKRSFLPGQRPSKAGGDFAPAVTKRLWRASQDDSKNDQDDK